MGAKYTSQSTSGYNASAPADDGSQAASNLITWAKVKTAIGDVLKTFGEAINTALVSAFDYTVRQITTSDNTVASDHMRTVEIAPTVSGGITVSLMDAATATTNYKVWIKNSSTISQTVGRVTGSDTIDGTAGNITLPSKSAALFMVNAAASGYLLIGWRGPDIDTNPLVVGSSDGTKKIRLEVDGLSTTTTRVITVPDKDLTLGIVLATQQASTSGTSIDFTGIPSGVRRITVMLKGVSTNGTDNIWLQIGDSGGIETNAYDNTFLGASSSASGAIAGSTSAFVIAQPGNATSTQTGVITLTLMDASSFTWAMHGSVGDANQTRYAVSAGVKATSAELDRVRITTSAGTNTFDAGAINISYEF